jgi:hypothetical protein
LTDSLFGGDPAVNAASVDQLVGEGKKFKTVDDLAKGKLESDAYIEQLKGELSGLRQDLTARVKLEEVLDRLTSRSSEENDEGDNRSLDNSSSQPAISESELNRLIDHKITQKERERTVSQNRTQALDNLKRLYGSDYEARLEEYAATHGLDRADINYLAGKSPTALLELMGVKAPVERPFTPPRSAVNTQSFSNNLAPEQGSWDYYQKMKKDNPTLYWSPKVQNQMHNDLIKRAQSGQNIF